MEAVRQRLGGDPDAEPLIEAWFCANQWVQPVLYLSQRADVRAILPQLRRYRQRLPRHHQRNRDNFQLHTLLARALIGDPANGLLPGRRPTDVELAAATTGDPQPDQPMLGVWNPVAANGSLIWNEGRPHGVPHLDGVRVVMLDAAAYQRSWNAGRAYP